MNNLSLTEIENRIKKTNKKIKFNIDVNEQYLQGSKKQEIKSLDQIVAKNVNNYNIKTEDNYIRIQLDSVLELPPILKKILGENYYTYGIKKHFGIIESIMMVIDDNFKLESNTTKEEKMSNILNTILENVDTYYSKFNYSLYKIKKSTLVDNIICRKLRETDIIRYVSDFLEVKTVILDAQKMIYETYGNSDTIVLIISQKDYLLPIINSYNKSLKNEVLNEIDKIFINKTNKPSKIMDVNKSVKLDGQLDPIRKYKVSELQEIAKNKKIDIFVTINEKKKKKTKQMLYNEILKS